MNSSVSMGIILGLVVGKPLGISIIAYTAARLGLAELPEGVRWRQFVSASFLAGIGFTMALFISGAAFVNEPGINEISKLAILVASIVAAVLGTVALIVTSPNASATTAMQPTAATTD